MLLLQGGRVPGSTERALQRFVETRMRLLARVSAKRYDLHRFETRLYRWDGSG